MYMLNKTQELRSKIITILYNKVLMFKSKKI